MKTQTPGVLPAPLQSKSSAGQNDLNLQESATNGDVPPVVQPTDPEKHGRSFLRSIAAEVQTNLHARRPDVTAAFVLSTVLTWKPNRCHRARKQRVPGARYLSAEKIREDLPWLSRSAVSGALKRLARAYKKDFVLAFEGKKVANIVVSSKLQQRCAELQRFEGQVSVNPSDAVTHGVIQAVIIRNLLWKTRHFTDPVRDARGNVYGEMSPTALSDWKAAPDPIQEGFDQRLDILPWSRQEISASITELVSKNIFVEHPTRAGFYRLGSETEGSGLGQKIQNCRATTVSANATTVSANATTVSAKAAITSFEIEEDRSLDRKSKIESDKIKTVVGPAAPPPVISSAHWKKEFIDPITDTPAPASNPCRSVEDMFPGILAEVDRRVQIYRELRRTGKLSIPVSNDELPHDIILDPVAAEWEELLLPLDPETRQPYDFNDKEGKIERILDDFPSTFCDCSISYLCPTTEEERELMRGLFDRYPGLNASILCQIVEHIYHARDATGEYELEGSSGSVWRNNYFAQRVRTPVQFVRYFEQLFLECFAPVTSISEGNPQDYLLHRWWTAPRVDSVDCVLNELSDRELDYAEEPFQTIFKRARMKAKGAAEAAPGAGIPEHHALQP